MSRGTVNHCVSILLVTRVTTTTFWRRACVGSASRPSCSLKKREAPRITPPPRIPNWLVLHCRTGSLPCPGNTHGGHPGLGCLANFLSKLPTVIYCTSTVSAWFGRRVPVGRLCGIHTGQTLRHGCITIQICS